MDKSMPLLRGLLIKGGEPLPEGLEEGLSEAGVPVISIADLDDAQLQALVDMATAAASDGSLDAALAAGGGAYGPEDAGEALDAGGEPVEGEEEAEETAEDEAAETPEEQAAEEAAGTELHSTTDFVDMAAACAEECADLAEEVAKAAKEVDDPALVEDMVVQAKELATTCGDTADGAKDALKADDIQAAAAAAAACDEAREGIKTLLLQVQQAAVAPPPEEGAAPVPAPKGGKGGRAAPPPAKPAADPNEAPLATWANMAAKGCH